MSFLPIVASACGLPLTCSRKGTTFARAELLQCPTDEQQQQCGADLASADQAVAVLSGTLAAAVLVYAMLPIVRARNSSRRRSPSSARGARHRVRAQLSDGVCGCESVGVNRDERQGTRRNVGGGHAAGSELVLAKLPEFNDERGWRHFFDAQIYKIGYKEEQHPAATIVSQITSLESLRPRDTRVPSCTELRRQKVDIATATAARDERYRTIRDKISRAAAKAAVDDAQMFNEFWQM